MNLWTPTGVAAVTCNVAKTAWKKLSALDVYFGDLQQDAEKRIKKYLTAYEQLTQDLVTAAKKDLNLNVS